jgi:hypothetical protein
MESCYFTVDASGVISERFGDEVIAINLNRGTYYSLNRTAGEIFELAAGEPSLDEIQAALAMRYDAPLAEMEAQVARFLSELEREGLVGRAPARTAAAPPSLPLAERSPAAGRLPAVERKTPFLAPALTVHRDMQDLFLLDPIHEVGEAGWPEKQTSSRTDSER